MNLKAVTPLVARGLLTLTACGESGSSVSNTVPATADVGVRAQDGIAWDAKTYTATATDGKVSLYGVNGSGLAHNLHVVDADGNDLATPLDLPSRGANGTIELELAPGEYRVICKITGHTTMDSKLIIT